MRSDPQDNSPAILLESVRMEFPIPKRYRDYLLRPFYRKEKTLALGNINLKIDRGSRVAFLGPNGAGKTSLLKLIAGLIFPTRGRVIVQGHDTLKNNNSVRKSVGFALNEERSFYWRLTGIQNLQFFGTLDNLSGRALEAKIQNLLELVGLEEVGRKPVGAYSSGMKQRLAIARGLLSDPEILILDEPTKTLDPVSAEDLVELISSRLTDGNVRTLLVATHNLEEVSALCEQVCVLKRGSLVSSRSISEIRDDRQSLSQYYRQCVS